MNPIKRLEPGTHFASYDILRPIGVGGTAVVYEGLHTALGKRVAVKVLHEHLAANTLAKARFLGEGRAASAIRHPGVVEIFEIGVQGRTPYLVMELLDGEDLGSHLQVEGKLSVTSAIDLLLPTMAAVMAAHAAGVVHRDLKPRNIFLVHQRRSVWRPKVVDFGISKVVRSEEEAGWTQTETLLGTLEYMAPEQVRSAKNAAERSDQYSLGVILYECVTGRRPFTGNSTYELLHAVVTAPFATPRSISADIPPELEEAILRAMSRNPSERFPSLDCFGRALLPFASDASRAWCREDFEPPAAVADDLRYRSLSWSVTPGPSAEGESRLVATLAERAVPSPAKQRLSGKAALRTVVGAIAAGAAVAGFVSPFDVGPDRGAVSHVSSIDAPRAPAPATAGATAQAEPVALPFEPPGATAAAPFVAPRSTPPPPWPPKRRQPANGQPAPTTTSLPPSSSSATLVPSMAASSDPPAVRRGFNGAPIVE